jgi:hypothetical protein
MRRACGAGRLAVAVPEEVDGARRFRRQLDGYHLTNVREVRETGAALFNPWTDDPRSIVIA